MAEYGLPELTEDIINEICGGQDQRTGSQKLEDVVTDTELQGSGTSQIPNHANQGNGEDIHKQGTMFQLSAQALWNSAL